MDTTEKYIRMCEKAEEIQGSWKPEAGDFFVREKEYYRFDPFVVDFHREILTAEWFDEDQKFIWLPRQDQLQEILGILWDEYEYYIRKLLDFILDLSFTKMTMEQLWLTFVMHEKYGKVWDDKKGEWTTPSNEKIP